VTSTFKRTIVGQELTKWPDQFDFSVELAKAKGAKPDAIFAFYPGASGGEVGGSLRVFSPASEWAEIRLDRISWEIDRDRLYLSEEAILSSA
jgi:hypothetical protein